MITDQLKQAVIREAELLLQHATREERKKIDFARLQPSHTQLCIYGQMTGSCYSNRASTLLKSCAIPYTHNSNVYEAARYPVFDDEDDRSDFSALEFYITQDGAKNAHLIDFLQEKTPILNL